MRNIFPGVGAVLGVFALAAGLSAPASASPTSAARAATSASPASVAQAYIAALSAHRPAAACALMVPALRSFVRHGSFGDGSTSNACVTTLRRMFAEKESYSLRRWQSARIVRLAPTIQDGDRAEVPMRLEHRYTCSAVQPGDRYCKRRAYRFLRPDRVFLLRDATGRWAVAKGGTVLRRLAVPEAYASAGWLSPPALPADLLRPASLPAPDFACEAANTTASATDPIGDVLDDDHHPVLTAPWLDISSVSFVRTGPTTVCATIALGGVPHPDADYTIWWNRPVNDSGDLEGWSLDLWVDARGRAHVLGGRTPARFGFQDGRLQIELTPEQGFDPSKRWLMSVGADNGPAYYETLLGRYSHVSDKAPDNRCLRYPDGQIVADQLCLAPAG